MSIKRWVAIVLFPLILLKLWGLDPDKSIDKYLLDQWETSDGLPSNTINAIIQTSDGYLWLASSNGLIRFDGIKFSKIPFAGKEELSPPVTPEPITLQVNREGNLYIGSNIGLTRCDNGRFKTFTTRDGLSENRIRRVIEDMQGNLWISFMAGYVDRFSDGKFTAFNNSHGLEGKKINAIVENRIGNLLFATREKGIFAFREGQFYRYPIAGLDKSQIITMYPDHEENLWMGTKKGLLRVGEKGTVKYDGSHGLSHDYITVIKEDSEQNLWVGTLKGLNRVKRKDDSAVFFESLLYPAVIFCLYEDREKSLWIGTENSGLKRLKDSKFTSFAVPKALQEETIISIFPDRQGNTWMGSLGGKLFLFQENRLIKTIIPPGAAGTGISAIAEDSQGNLWLGTIGKGIYQKKNTEFLQFTTREGLADNLVTSLYKDSQGNLWVSTFAGVNIIRGPGAGIETFIHQQGLAGKIVNNIYEDKSQNIWIAADQGVTFLEKGKTARQYIKYYLKGIPAVSIYEDPSPPKGENSIYWISTNGAGLMRLKPGDGTVYAYTTKQGMTSNFIFQFFEELGNFWLMSSSGILRVGKKELNRLAKAGTGRIDCTSFGREDGLQSTEFHNELSRHSALQTKDGELWFVTKKGISMVNPKKMRVNKLPPPVVIEKVLFDHRALDLVPSQNSYDMKPNARRAMKSFDQTFSKVWLPAGQVEFHFTAPSFLSPGKMKFKYRLEGFDKEWKYLPPGSKRTAYYQNLEPGTYTFRVIACNSDGIWNRTGDSITFTLQPFFYQTLVFKIFVLLILAALLTAAVYFIHKKRLFHKKKKPKASSLNSDFAEECIKKLKHLMVVEKVYCDAEISLQSLAEKLSITPHQLSQLVNEGLNRSFSDFINYYRIEEVKRVLQSPIANETITNLAHDVGFNSMTAFYNAFKKNTNMTPSQYKEKLKKKN